MSQPVNYYEQTSAQLQALLASLRQDYQAAQAKGLKLDMSRGKPEAAQLTLSDKMLTNLDSAIADSGIDCRNYAPLDGLPEAKKLMGDLIGVAPEHVFVGGNASLSLMHDVLTFGCLYGLSGQQPWSQQKNIKFLCPSPGYDRHFAMTEHMGFELITVPMTAQGPDMDVVEELIKDPTVKGIWCVPKYSNPQGITYSDDVVRRFAALTPAAPDFRILWDNAYAVHDLDVQSPDTLLNLADELAKTGREDMAFTFTSTSKITFAGGGISAVATSKNNFAWLMKHKFYQTIGYDKVNQLRHCRLFPDMATVQAHMAGHAAIVKPKFDVVLEALAPLAQEGIARWDTPKGGYFVSLDVPQGCAKRTVTLCKEAGVTLTGAGATFPYGKDPADSNIRVAPTFPPMEELKQAVVLLCLCVRIAALESILADRNA